MDSLDISGQVIHAAFAQEFCRVIKDGHEVWWSVRHPCHAGRVPMKNSRTTEAAREPW